MPPRFIIHDGATIRENRDELPSRPRKRQRTNSVIDAGGYSEHCLAPVGPVEDDLEFYRNEAGADCVVRVGNTRFKVNGPLLSDASPVLQDILMRHRKPTHWEYAPLVLIADADEFRALLWALHANPQDLATQPREHADVDRVLLIAAISRQYCCASLEAWSRTALLDKVTLDQAFVSSCSSALFTRIISVSIRTRHDALLDATIAQWTARIRRGDAPCVPAILAADLHELPHLRGIAYYFHIQVMLAQQTAVTSRGATQFQMDPKLSNGQVMRLLSGHWSLVSLWERLRRTPIKFTCAQGCRPGRGGCAATWGERWGVAATSEKINGMSSASLLTLLAAMRDQLAVDQELANNIPPQCKRKALDALVQHAAHLEDGLADHFFGWL